MPPLDPSLNNLAQQQQQPGWQPPPQSPLNMSSPLSDLSTMTHQPEQPNPAQSYLEAAKGFAAGLPGGITGIAPSVRQYMPGIANTLGGLFQSQAAQDAFTFMGGPMLGTLRMEAAPASAFFSTFGAKDHFKLFSKETGKEMGRLHTTYSPSTKDLKIDFLGSAEAGRGFGGYQNVGSSGWGMGTHELQTLGPEILKNYPDVETISFIRLPGIREVGSRGRAGRESRVMKFKVNRMPDGGITMDLIESHKVGYPPAPSPSAPLPPAPEPPAPRALQSADTAWTTYVNAVNSRVPQEEIDRFFDEYFRTISGSRY